MKMFDSIDELRSNITSKNAAESHSNEFSASQANHPEWDCLLIACQKGDASAVKRILREIPCSNSHANPMGQSALHIAAWWNHVECVELLLHYGADTHAINSFTGATPLHECLQSNQVHRQKGQRRQRIECISLLLKAKANARTIDYLGREPLECFLLVDEADVADHAEIKELILENERITKHPLQNLLQIVGLKDSTLEEIERLWRDTVVPNFDSDLRLICSLLSTEILSVTETWIDQAQDISEISNQNSFAQTDFVSIDYLLKRVTWVWNKLVEVSSRIATKHSGNVELIPELCFESIRLTILSQLSKALFDRYEHLYKMKKYSSNESLSLLKDDAFLSAWTKYTILVAQERDNKTNMYVLRSSRDSVFENNISQTWMTITRRDYFELARLWWDRLRISPIGVVNRQGMTALQFAARSGHFRMVKWLITHPTLSSSNDSALRWIRNVDYLGHTALAAAKSNQHQKIVELLQGYYTLD